MNTRTDSFIFWVDVEVFVFVNGTIYIISDSVIALFVIGQYGNAVKCFYIADFSYI